MRSVRGGVAPTRHGIATAWRSEGAHLLVEAVNSVGRATAVWTFLALAPLGSDYHLPPALALGGITKWLDKLVSQRRPDSDRPLPVGASMHTHATDEELGADGQLTVHGTNDGSSRTRGPNNESVGLRGQATDLLMAILRRCVVHDLDVEIDCDGQVWRHWLAVTPSQRHDADSKNGLGVRWP
jgi:hypothetical protein